MMIGQSLILRQVHMRVGKIRKRECPILLPRIPLSKGSYSDGLPTTIEDGQSANWAVRLDKDRTWIKDLLNGSVKSKSDVKSLRFLIHPSHGKKLIIKPEESLLNEMLSVFAASSGEQARQSA